MVESRFIPEPRTISLILHMQFIDTVYAQEAEPAVTAETGSHEGAASTGVLGSLGINGTLFVSQLVNFAIIVVIVWFLILEPLTKKLAERQKMIDDSIDNSKKVQRNLEKSEQEFQKRIDEAKVEANKIVEHAVTESEKMNGEMKTKAKQEIETLVDQAKKNIKIEREEIKAEIKKETAEMIVTALEKILSEKITDKKDKELIWDMVAKMK